MIYLDNAATTRVAKEVLTEMNKYQEKEYGNPSSINEMGERARKAIDKAREKIAKKINCKPWEIIFTSGATESNNLVILGLSGKKKIIISAIEHASVYEPCRHLREEGCEVKEIGVDKEGFVRIDEIEKEIDEKTLLVSVIHGHNEFGTLQDIERIGKLCRAKGVLFHVDAAQSFCKENIDVRKCCIDLLSASGHKINGPKGIGFLYVKEGIRIQPLMYGGGQERGLRSGTENVAGIMGMAKAVEISDKINKKKIKEMRDHLMSELEKLEATINGAREKRLYNNVHFSMRDIDAEMLVVGLSQRGIMCSTRSACSEKEKEDRALKALGVQGNNSVRMVLNNDIKKKDIDAAISEIKKLTVVRLK